MEYHYILGICLLVTTVITKESISQIDPKKTSQQIEKLSFIQEFLVNTTNSVNIPNYTLPSKKNTQTDLEIKYDTKDGNPYELPTFKDNNITKNNIQVIPVPSAVSSAIDTLPVHPRIPRRSLTRRKTKVRLNRQNKRRGYFAQPARILLPPFRQKEPIHPERSEKPVEPVENSVRDSDAITNIEQSTKVVPITATPTASLEIQEVPTTNEPENKQVAPQFHKVFISPPLRFLLPPLFYENYVNAQSSTVPPRKEINVKVDDPIHSESESSDTFNIESRPVSRLPILIIETDPSDYPEGSKQESNFRYSTLNPSNNVENRDVELINNIQSSTFKNHLLISVTTEITPLRKQQTSFANFDQYEEHNPAFVNHTLDTGGHTETLSGSQTQHFSPDSHHKHQPFPQDHQHFSPDSRHKHQPFPQDHQHFSPDSHHKHQSFPQDHQQFAAQNKTFFVPHQNYQNRLDTRQSENPQFALGKENLFISNPNLFNNKNPQKTRENMQGSQGFPIGSTFQQIAPTNHQDKDAKQIFNTPNAYQPNSFDNHHLFDTNKKQHVFNNNEQGSHFHPQNHSLLPSFENNQNNIPFSHITENTHFDQHQQMINTPQQLPPPNNEVPRRNNLKPSIIPNDRLLYNQREHSIDGNDPQTSLNPHQGTLNDPLDPKHQQLQTVSDHHKHFSSNHFPSNDPIISLVLQPPFEDVSNSPQENLNPFSIQQTFSPSHLHQNNGQEVPQVFPASVDTHQALNINTNLPPKMFEHRTVTLINSSANIENTHFDYYSTEATTPVPKFPSTPVPAPILRGPNIEQALFETGSFHIFENVSSESLDPMLAMMDKPLLTQDVFETGMKIMVMNTEKIKKMKVNRGMIKYKHLNQFNLFSESGARNPPVLVVAETSYYNIPRGAVELYHDSEIRVIPGRPGRDYPTLHEPPASSDFSCRSVKQHRGYVADPATRCQVFYICVGAGPGEAMLCPNGTLFSQDYLVCDWWYNIDCQPYA